VSAESVTQTECTRDRLNEILAYMEQLAASSVTIASAAEEQVAVAETVNHIHRLSEDTRRQSSASLDASTQLQTVSRMIESKVGQFEV